MGNRARSNVAGIRYAALAVAVTLAAVAGYLGYATFPRFELSRTVGAGLFALAAAGGVASFFSPCSFPLLVTLLARSTEAEQRRGARIRRALLFAAALSLGASVFVLGVGAVIAAGGRGLAGSVTFTSATGRAIRATVGGGLVVLGLVQLGVLRLPFHAVERIARPLSERQARLRREHPVLGFAVFGFGYLLAGFG